MDTPKTYPAATPIKRGDVVSIVNNYSVMIVPHAGKRVGQWIQLIIRMKSVFPSEKRPIGFALNTVTRPGQQVFICKTRPVQNACLDRKRPTALLP